MRSKHKMRASENIALTGKQQSSSSLKFVQILITQSFGVLQRVAFVDHKIIERELPQERPVDKSFVIHDIFHSVQLNVFYARARHNMQGRSNRLPIALIAVRAEIRERRQDRIEGVVPPDEIAFHLLAYPLPINLIAVVLVHDHVRREFLEFVHPIGQDGRGHDD